MYLKSVHLENVKGFKKLDFDFKRPNGSFAGWTVIVGGNASGKSTLLKAIALSLLGPDEGRQLSDPVGWIRAGEKKAESTVQLVWDKRIDPFKKGGSHPGDVFPVGVRWGVEDVSIGLPYFRAVEKRNSKGTRIQTAERSIWDPGNRGWFSMGYGPMRRLTGSSADSVRLSVGKNAMSRFTTLFREDAALSESETWLKLNHSRSLESPRDDLKMLLEGVSAMMSDGLLPYNMKISKITVDHVYVKSSNGIELPMRDISDGCRSMYATVLDLIHGLYEVYGIDGLFLHEGNSTIVNRPGVVLIDEIEAHLHPSWQRDIPMWLKKHFPYIQFIVSTHSPLVAQAADDNGIFWLPSLGDSLREPRRLDTHEVIKIRLGRAEKTLLGVAFGLSSSRSYWAIGKIDQWKKLNAKKKSKNGLSKKEEVEFQKLKKDLDIALFPEELA